jgi:hypothetical protein
VFHIEPLTWQAFQEAQASAGLFDIKVDAEEGSAQMQDPRRIDAMIMTRVVASNVTRVDNVTDADDKPITTGRELVALIADMDESGVVLLRDLYKAIRNVSHLGAGEKKT